MHPATSDSEWALGTGGTCPVPVAGAGRGCWQRQSHQLDPILVPPWPPPAPATSPERHGTAVLLHDFIVRGDRGRRGTGVRGPKRGSGGHRSSPFPRWEARSGQRGQAHHVLGPAEDHVVLADEDVAEDPELARLGGDVHALEGQAAVPLALRPGTWRSTGWLQSCWNPPPRSPLKPPAQRDGTLTSMT